VCAYASEVRGSFSIVLQKGAALLALAFIVGCGSAEKAAGPEPTERHLVYEKLIGEKGIWIADSDGTRPRLLVPDGSSPSISPDGKWVAYFAECKERAGSELPCTYIVSTSGGEPRLLSTSRLDEPMTWSPTSERVASISAFGGHEYQQGGDDDELLTIDVASGEEVMVAHAPQFFGWSFSPDGESIVFAPAHRNEDGYFSDDIDLFVTSADGGEARRITETGDSTDPVWGPESIAFAKHIPLADGGAVPAIWQIQSDGTDLARITKRLPSGLGKDGMFPIEWSEDGGALLAGVFRDLGADPVVVDPETGATQELGRFGRPWGAQPIALSRDGGSVLVQEGSSAHVSDKDRTVLIVASEGAKPKVVARGAWVPSWNR
jgi:Tol biopolymer transport system component